MRQRVIEWAQDAHEGEVSAPADAAPQHPGVQGSSRSAQNPARKPALRSVTSDQPAAKPAPEFWIGVHLTEPASQPLLERLAIRAQRFTPRVSLVPPDGLLLEVK